MTRVTLTEPKTVLTDGMSEASFARFTLLMATFNKERVASRRFGRWVRGSTIKTRGCCEGIVRCKSRLCEVFRGDWQFRYDAPRGSLTPEAILKCGSDRRGSSSRQAKLLILQSLFRALFH